MKPSDPIKLVAELLDLPIMDKDGRYCGIVDDVELSGSAGKEMRLHALLVGPGAYEGRLPGWAFAVTRMIAGNRITRVPVNQIEKIHTVVTLKCRAEQAGLNAVENRVRGWIPKVGAM
jgi:sporulation protein YlmC with PRC-barrel domain